MTARALASAALAALAATACSFTVDYSGTSYQCDPTGSCPNGFECRSGMCVPEGTPYDDAGVDVDSGPGAPDAAANPDAGVSAACGTTARLVDDFDDGVTDLQQWGSGFADPGTERVEQDGQLVIRVTAGAGDAWAGYYSRHAHDLTGHSAQVRVAQVGPQFTVLEVQSADHAKAQVVQDTEAGVLRAAVYDLPSGNGSRAELPYDPDAQRWWRIREQSGNMYWEYSADGETWQELHHEESPFPIEHIRVILAAGGSVAEDSEAHFDDFNPNGDPSEPWCPISGATDDFEDGVLDVLWADSWDDIGCALAETGGFAEIAFDGTANSWCGFESFPVFDACDGHASIEIETPLDAAESEMWFEIYLPDGRLSMGLYEGMLHATEYQGSSATMQLSITYDATAHRWWRIRTDGSTTYWETSPDGTSWTVRTTRPITLDCRTAYFGFGAGLWNAWAGGATSVRFDNFNVGP